MKKLIKKVLMTLISLFKWEKKIPIVSIKQYCVKLTFNRL